MPKITKRGVDALLPAERERVVWDDDIKGFGVRVHPTGRKVYIVKYRHEGRSVKVTIGPHGPVTPAAARARAAEIVTLAKAGRDLAGKTPGARGSVTVADLARRFMDEYAPAHLKPSTARLYRKIIENRILPRFGTRRISDIGKSDVVALHHDMRDVPDHANRTLSVLSRMLTMAEVWEMRPEGANPCRHVKKYAEHKRERFLSDEEYRRLGSALRDAEGEGFASEMAAREAPVPTVDAPESERHAAGDVRVDSVYGYEILATRARDVQSARRCGHGNADGAQDVGGAGRAARLSTRPARVSDQTATRCARTP